MAFPPRVGSYWHATRILVACKEVTQLGQALAGWRVFRAFPSLERYVTNSAHFFPLVPLVHTLV